MKSEVRMGREELGERVKQPANVCSTNSAETGPLPGAEARWWAVTRRISRSVTASLGYVRAVGGGSGRAKVVWDWAYWGHVDNNRSLCTYSGMWA